MANKILKLKPGREKSLKHHNYWVFSGAIGMAPAEAEKGETIDIISAAGEFMAVGSWSPQSQICARAWSFKPETVDVNFFRKRLRAAQNCREISGIAQNNSGYRLAAAEGDGLPGIVIDRYNNIMVMQLLSAGSDFMRSEIVNAIRAEFPEVTAILERSDVAVRKKEGLEEQKELLFGDAGNSLPEIKENNCKFICDVQNGHKTGFYFDQRSNRALAGTLAAGRTVLNLFSYTGGFGVTCALNNAKLVENVDSSESALALAAQNMALNGVSADKFVNTEANVFELLRAYEKAGKRFDMIILDPPKLVDAQARLMKGARAYKELAMRSFKLLNPDGLLFTFSCSGLVTPELFAKITFDAAYDAGCSGLILRRLTQDADHPVRLNHPESSYLKGLLVQKCHA